METTTRRGTYNLYSSLNIIRGFQSKRMRGVRHVARMVGRRGAHRVSTRRRDGKRQLGRSRSRWEDNSKVYFEEVGWEGIDWIALTQDRGSWRGLVNVVMKLRVR